MVQPRGLELRFSRCIELTGSAMHGTEALGADSTSTLDSRSGPKGTAWEITCAGKLVSEHLQSLSLSHSPVHIGPRKPPTQTQRFRSKMVAVRQHLSGSILNSHPPAHSRTEWCAVYCSNHALTQSCGGNSRNRRERIANRRLRIAAPGACGRRRPFPPSERRPFLRRVVWSA